MNWRGPSILVLTLLLGGCGNRAAPSLPAPPPPGSGWVIEFSPAMPPGSTGEAFAFPSDAATGVDYVIRGSGPLASGQTITMRFTLAGDGKLYATEGISAARVRLFMQRQGDSMTADEQYKRWWSKAYVDLVSPGEFTLTARIAPDQWTSVFGASGDIAPGAFADCIANLACIGFTFGGDFAGHGVYAVGDVRFNLTEFSVA